MSDHYPEETPPNTATGDMVDNINGLGERSVGEIREEFGSTVTDLKQKYGQLLEQRDRQIRDLSTQLAQAPPVEAKHRVLIVDSAKSTAAIVNHYLEGHPVEIVQVAAGKATEALRSNEYDAIMVETACIVKPGVNGVTLCRQLCEGGDRKTVVAMSSRPGDRIKTSVENAGAMFLRKPFGRSQLVELMRGVLPKEKK